MEVKNLILLIELEQFEEDAKEISKTIRFVLKKNFFLLNSVLLPKCYEQRLYTDKDLLVWINQK